MSYIPVIGLEIHCELLTDSKMFCSCRNAFGGKPNSRVCPICTGFPGMLPTVNSQAVSLAAKAGFALNCAINKHSSFDRKNYFYPDLPKAYQITQFYNPICKNGSISLVSGKTIRIVQIHMEEDAGKLVHDGTASLADYNRCGVPLIEIVTAPDFRNAKEVSEFIRTVALRLKYADVCDGRMEQGSLRVDVNISLMKEGSDVFGTRAEIKNLNSLKSVESAIHYEIQRQTKILDAGNTVIQETRRFDENTRSTFSMRSKEEAHDYRYFPEPDIPELYIDDEALCKLRSEMPLMPDVRFKLYTQDYGLPAEDAELIASSKALSDFYNEATELYPEYKLCANILLSDVNYHLNKTGVSIWKSGFKASDVAQLARLCNAGKISRNSVKDILEYILKSGKTPEEIAAGHGFMLSDNIHEVTAAVDDFLSGHTEAVAEYRSGSEKLFGFFMGQIMRTLGKSANPVSVKKILEERLNNYE